MDVVRTQSSASYEMTHEQLLQEYEASAGAE